MFIRRLITSIVWNLLIYGILLFLPARTFDWWRAWVLIGVLLIATIITMFSVMRTRPELLKERLKGLIQKGPAAVRPNHRRAIHGHLPRLGRIYPNRCLHTCISFPFQA